MFGAFAPLPLRLTANSATEGWTASQQSRLANDLTMAWRTMPLAVMTVEVGASSVSLVSYNGRNGVGTTHAPTLTYTSATQPCKAIWEPVYDDELETTLTWVVRHADVQLHGTSSSQSATIREVGTINGADVVVTSGVTTPYRMTITVYGDWGDQRNIGDYAGDINKRDCSKEAVMPYAAQWYHTMRSARGSAYTEQPLTFVDFENLAVARMMAAVFSRGPEKLIANSLPAHADEKLEYWTEVLAIAHKDEDPRWLLRQRCATHFEAAIGVSIEDIKAAIQSLLGDAYVDLHTFEGSDLDNPPNPTYWPAGIHGDPTYTIGGPTWLSRRAHLRIEVVQPPGVALSEFLQLMNVQLFQLLDPLLPAWVTWNWSEGSDGFRVGVDRIGVDAL